MPLHAACFALPCPAILKESWNFIVRVVQLRQQVQLQMDLVGNQIDKRRQDRQQSTQDMSDTIWKSTGKYRNKERELMESQCWPADGWCLQACLIHG